MVDRPVHGGSNPHSFGAASAAPPGAGHRPRRLRRAVTAGACLSVAAALACVAGPSSPHARAGTTPYRVLFDNTHAETAGNADWVISTSQPDPTQQNPTPTRETDWTGGISAWGVALQQTGRYQLDTLPSGQHLSYGSSSSLDLKNFNVLVLPEPNTLLTASEKTAVMSFVQAGGGLFMVADHTGSDRNNDGYDSLEIFNDLMSNNSVDSTDPFGLTFDAKNIGNDYPSGIPSSAATDPIIDGPFGPVTAGAIYNGTTETLHPGDNPAAKGEIYVTGSSTSGTTGVFFATSTFGSGRVAAWGDSSDIDDGTCSSGNTCYNGWNDHSDAALALNATEWLAGGSSTPPPPPPPPPPGTELITNGGFESGSTGWQESSNGGYEIVSTKRPHTGSESAWLCGNNNCSDSIYQTVTIPSGITSAAFSYWVYIDTQETSHPWDYLKVQVRSTSGSVLRTVSTYSDGSTKGSWFSASADLSAYAGQTVQIAFVATNDSRYPTDFFVDDVSLQTS